jgi:hypothetical protein
MNPFTNKPYASFSASVSFSLPPMQTLTLACHLFKMLLKLDVGEVAWSRKGKKPHNGPGTIFHLFD